MSRLNLLRPNDGGDTRLFDQVEGLLNGQSRNRGTVTLAASTTATIVSDPRFESAQTVVLMPTTANAAAAIATTYVSARTAKQFTLTHSSAVSVDRTFEYIFVG